MLATLSRRCVLLSALLSSACAAHDGPADPPTPSARVEVKIASVQLVQNCSDPPSDADAEAKAAAEARAVAAEPAAASPMPAPGGVLHDVSAREMAVGARRGDGPGGWSPPCTQSTMQLSIANAGDREGKLRIEGVRLLDAASKRDLGKIEARKPSQWNPGGTYQPWDQVVPAGATVKVGYRLADPDWSQVESGADPDTRPYVLEIDVSVDGVSQTVRSPEFVREPVHMIVT
jgi:hypothetical protein